jgi:hypothetical protein
LSITLQPHAPSGRALAPAKAANFRQRPARLFVPFRRRRRAEPPERSCRPELDDGIIVFERRRRREGRVAPVRAGQERERELAAIRLRVRAGHLRELAVGIG